VARYGQAFKREVVAQLLPPGSASIEAVSRDLGISVRTLRRWRSEALTMAPPARTWTAADKFEAVLATAAMDDAGVDAWCREHGGCPQTLRLWRQTAMQALEEPGERRATSLETKAYDRRVQDVERLLAEASAAFVELQAIHDVFLQLVLGHPPRNKATKP